MGACLNSCLSKKLFFSSYNLIAAVLFAAIGFSSCRCAKSDGDGKARDESAQTTNVAPVGKDAGAIPDASNLELVQKGKSVYSSICISCHNVNPKIAGSLGPDVWGSSRELIEVKSLKGTYPAGYKPKRASHAMVKLSLTTLQIDALAAYLNSGN